MFSFEIFPFFFFQSFFFGWGDGERTKEKENYHHFTCLSCHFLIEILRIRMKWFLDLFFHLPAFPSAGDKSSGPASLQADGRSQMGPCFAQQSGLLSDRKLCSGLERILGGNSLLRGW